MKIDIKNLLYLSYFFILSYANDKLYFLYELHNCFK